MVMFLKISINNICILVFLSLKITDILTLRYGFENHPYEYCHEFPFTAIDRHIVLKDSYGTKIWNCVNHKDVCTDTNVLNNSTDRNILNASFLNNSLRLCFSNLSRTDTGNYSLEEVRTGRRKNFFIDVDYEAKIRTLVRETNIEEYEEANLNCDVDSKPPANITWILPQNGIDGKIGQNEENISKLTFANCTCEHTGKYICSASNKPGTVDTKSTFLNVTCKPRFIDEDDNYSIAKKIKASIGEELMFNVNIQANPSPRVKLISPGVDVSIQNLSDINFGVFIKTLISSDSDFRWYSIIIGNSKGNVAIILEVDKKGQAVVNSYHVIIGILMSLFVCLSIVIVIYKLVKRMRKRKKRHALNDSVHYVNDDFVFEEAEGPDYRLDDGYLYQNRIRESELTATESYEDLSITADDTSYEEMNPKTEINAENFEDPTRESGSDEAEINCNIRGGSDGYLIITGLKTTDISPDREGSEAESSTKEDVSTEDSDGYINMDVSDAGVENPRDIEQIERGIEEEGKKKSELILCECDANDNATIMS